jgi:formylmethanofuran dehydrogenase subunit E
MSRNNPFLHVPERQAIHNGIVKAVQCRGCHENFYESVDSTRKYHLTCEPVAVQKKRIQREINH